MDEVGVAPLRSLDDFLLSSARFQVPNVKDTQRWSNRILNNLLYYQTNYFLAAGIIFLLVGILHPVDMLVGVFTVCILFSLFVYVTNNKVSYKRFKRRHPSLGILVILVGCYLSTYLVGSVIVFMFGIALPLLGAFVHASLRMRNLKNKVTNNIEFVGLKRTPMGLLLEALGQEQEAGS